MKIKDTIIVINSSHRAGKVITPTLFPEDVIEWVIAVPEDQIEEYAKYWPNKLVPIPNTVAPYLSSQRQWVMENYWDAYKYVWFMDDDLKFSYRATEEVKLTKCVDFSCITRLITAVHSALQDVPLVGVSTRLGNNFIVGDYDEITRVTRCYAINSAVFRSIGVVFNPYEPFQAQDFHVTLCFLNNGYKNRVLYKYAQEDGGSNSDGGCSVYRTSETQKNAMKWLAANHPEVTLKVKTNKTGWNLPGSVNNERLDCIIQWKKAYKPKGKPKRFF